MTRRSAAALLFAALLASCADDPTTGDAPDAGSADDDAGGPDGGGPPPSGLVFSPYKDTSIHLNWNTNVASTEVSGAPTPLVDDLIAHGGRAVTLAFATGACGSESWGGVPGAAMAAANVPRLTAAGIDYVLATGGAAGAFTCTSDADFATFIDRWASPNLRGVDLDIEAGQSQATITELARRIAGAHARYPTLRFSLTLATLAANDGAATAHSLGAAAPDSFNVLGVWTMAAVRAELGWDGTEATWPSYVTINLMTMDYGGPSPGVCVVAAGQCDMGASALQAAYNLHDHWQVPWSATELTPMIGGNDVQGEVFTLADADVVTAFARSQGLAGVHYWSYDRDVDCPPGAASPICNSMGGAGALGFHARFAAGLR